jgi:hypothetical protein
MRALEEARKAIKIFIEPSKHTKMLLGRSSGAVAIIIKAGKFIKL